MRSHGRSEAIQAYMIVVPRRWPLAQPYADWIAAYAHFLMRHSYRQRGFFAAIQAALDVDLMAAEVMAISFWMVDGPGAATMAAAIDARGGS